MSLKTLIQQKRLFEDRLDERQAEIKNILGVMGDGQGNLRVSGKDGYIYVLINGQSFQAFCGKVAPVYGKQCLIGLSLERGQKGSFYEVLSEIINNSTDPSVLQTGGYAPASRYEYGGQDPLTVNVRSVSFLRIGPSSTGGLKIDLFEGKIWSGSTFINITRQDIDLTAQIPSTSGKAALVMITINNSGTVVQTKGSEVNLTSLATTDRPAVPSNTVFVCGCVRVYNGQTEFREGNSNTDFDDLRFSYDSLRWRLTANDLKEPTGWLDPASVAAAMTYDPSTQKITITGTFYYYWRGVKSSVTNFVSSAHTNTVGHIYRLISTDGTNFTWTTDTQWLFSDSYLLVASVNYQTAYKYATPECHGLMDWRTHEELHETIGSYKDSGGTLDPASYTVASTTAANRRPNVVVTGIHDEDILHSLAALTSKTYNKFSLTSTTTSNYSGLTAEIIAVSGNQPYYNQFTGGAWTQTLMTANTFTCVWVVGQPTTHSANSESFRYLWVQGQSIGTLAAMQALQPGDVNLGDFSSAEFVFLVKIIINYQSAGGGNWVIDSVYNITGTHFSQGTASGTGSFQPLNTDLTAISNLTPSNDDVLQRKAGVWTNRTIAQLLADMVLTGISFATSTAVSATDTVRDAIGKLQAQNSAGRGNSGTSFPGSPATGDVYFRTDLGYLCYYSGATYGWLSVHEYSSLNYADDDKAGVTASSLALILAKLNSTYGFYVTRIAINTYVATTNNGSNYWNVTIRSENSTRTSTTSLYTFTTSADSPGGYVGHDGNPSTPTNATNKYGISINVTKTGTPGALYFACAVYYRLIVT
jgi:hypothetical protein